MRPIKLALENFGPYRERAEIDFSALGEFFLICGKTGSGKSTLFDAITYALFGQAPGARKGSESEFVSDFSKPGDAPRVEFEFSLSGTGYRVLRTAPFSRPKRGGGIVDVPPTAALFAAVSGAEGGWRPVADGVRDTNEKVPALIGLTAEEFSKIILLPQGDFQKFLEMESTERSLVLEKLFPVGLHERIAGIAKARTQEAKLELSVLEAELGRLAAEAGEEPEARLASLRGELEEALGLESGVMGEAAARERVLERERERAARAARAIEAAKARLQLEERGPAEEARAARIASAKAAAAVAPFSRSFLKAKAAVSGLAGRAALLSGELSALEAARPLVESKRARARDCVSLAAAAQGEVFRLNKAVEVWKRRAEALALFADAGTRSKDLDGNCALGAAELDRMKGELETLKPRPDEEELLRADIERFQGLISGLSSLADLARRRTALFQDLSRAVQARAEREEAYGKCLAGLEAAGGTLAALEAAATHSEVLRLAAALRQGEPCPVCGSREHPLPAAMDLSGVGRPSLADIEAARAERLRISGEAAALAAGLGHSGERLEEIGKALASLAGEMEEGIGALSDTLPAPLRLPGADAGEAAVFAQNLGSLSRETAAALAEARLKTSGFESRRREAAGLEEAIAGKGRTLDELREKAGVLRAELAARKALLAEAERDSGSVDPRPLRDAALESLKALEAERAGLEAECSTWEGSMARAKASLATLEGAREGAFGSLKALAQAGFLSGEEGRAEEAPPEDSLMGPDSGGLAAAIARADALSLPPSVLAAEEGAAASYREALAAARAKAASLEADLPAPGGEPPDIAALETALGEARAALAAARSRSDACRLSIARLEETLARRLSLEEKRDLLGEGSRTLNRLSELLLGKIPGRQLPFKNFVLAMYFREVTRRASVHLSRMSEGRYYLKPDDGLVRGAARSPLGSLDGSPGLNPADSQVQGRAPGRGKIGLGLRVLDSWTGQDRPTATLSGGEKFLTSISLALGLADSIRDRNGGVALDAVFIDEGFGSLDDEALDRAITVLDRIRGSRVIGIVSHVAGLKARIPARIEVEKTASGSRLSQSAAFSDQAL